MLHLNPDQRIFLAVKPVDFRCGIDGLAAACQTKLTQDPTSGHVFMFRNRKGTAVKILVYDGGAFWLCYRRLSKGTFNALWPEHIKATVLVSPNLWQQLTQCGAKASWQPV